MLYYWTRECDQGISDIKYDRKALQATLKKYITTGTKLQTILSRGQWRNLDEPMLPLHKARIESMISVCSLLILIEKKTLNLNVFLKYTYIK